MKILNPYFFVVVLFGLALAGAVLPWNNLPEESHQAPEAIHHSGDYTQIFESIEKIPGCHVQYLRSRNTYTITIMDHDSKPEITNVIQRVVDAAEGLPQYFLYISTRRFSNQCLDLLAECGPNLKGIYIGPNTKVSNDLVVSFCDRRECQLLTSTTWGRDVSK